MGGEHRGSARVFKFSLFVHHRRVSSSVTDPFETSFPQRNLGHFTRRRGLQLFAALSGRCKVIAAMGRTKEDASIGIIGMGDMGKMYAQRLSDAGWR